VLGKVQGDNPKNSGVTVKGPGGSKAPLSSLLAEGGTSKVKKQRQGGTDTRVKGSPAVYGIPKGDRGGKTGSSAIANPQKRGAMERLADLSKMGAMGGVPRYRAEGLFGGRGLEGNRNGGGNKQGTNKKESTNTKQVPKPTRSGMRGKWLIQWGEQKEKQGRGGTGLKQNISPNKKTLSEGRKLKIPLRRPGRGRAGCEQNWVKSPSPSTEPVTRR